MKQGCWLKKHPQDVAWRGRKISPAIASLIICIFSEIANLQSNLLIKILKCSKEGYLNQRRWSSSTSYTKEPFKDEYQSISISRLEILLGLEKTKFSKDSIITILMFIVQLFHTEFELCSLRLQNQALKALKNSRLYYNLCK